MGYDLSIPEGADFVLLQVKRDITRVLAREFTMLALAYAREHGVSKMLTDQRGYRSLSSISEKYDFARKDAVDIEVPHAWCVAILCDEITSDLLFLETMMRNAGYNYGVFTDEQAARAFLRDKSDA